LYEHKLVRVEFSGLFTKSPKSDYHRLVEEYAKEGWRLIQIFFPAVSVTGGGTSDYLEIIFERMAE
jgi:hypothetical protein